MSHHEDKTSFSLWDGGQVTSIGWGSLCVSLLTFVMMYFIWRQQPSANMYIAFGRLSLATQLDFGYIFQTQGILFDHAILTTADLCLNTFQCCLKLRNCNIHKPKHCIVHCYKWYIVNAVSIFWALVIYIFYMLVCMGIAVAFQWCLNELCNQLFNQWGAMLSLPMSLFWPGEITTDSASTRMLRDFFFRFYWKSVLFH